MALVESSHYTDEDGLRQQVGQYSAPPPVRLQRGGFGKLAIAFVAALGSGAAMYYAVTAAPIDAGPGETLLTMAPTDPGQEKPTVSDLGADQSIDAQRLNAERQLALLAGDAFLSGPWSAPDASPETGSQTPVVDLAASPEGQGVLIPQDTDVGSELPGGWPELQPETPAETSAEVPTTHETEPEPGPEPVHGPLTVAVRVPEPKHKPAISIAEPLIVERETQLASAEPVADAPQIMTAPASSRPESRPESKPEPGFLQASADHQASSNSKATDQFAASGSMLNPAPWVRITQRSTNGLLPVTGPNGETSRDHYARPFPADDARPRISIVIGGLGLSQKATTAAIDQLPPEVTLAFAPYGKNLQTSINRARNRGHEVLLELPMEPFDYPANDPGPYTLLTNNDAVQNTQRLEWLLAQFNGYVGVTNYLGAKFTASPEALLPVLRELDERGLLMLDDGTSNRSQVASLSRRMNVPYGTAARTIDLRVSRAAIDDALLDLENVTRRDGSAIGMGYAYPVTIDRIILWANTLQQKGFVLAPVSANVHGSKSNVDRDQHAPSY